MKKLYTIGFTKKSAEEFFTKLSSQGVRTVIDTRLNNASQLAGFSKKDDLEYFLRTICGISYVHLPILAPTKEILSMYRKKEIKWHDFESRFLVLIRGRMIENEFDLSILDGACLLCSEDSPQHCHRRLVAEYLQDRIGDIEIHHLQ